MRSFIEAKDAREQDALDTMFARARADASAIVETIAERYQPVRIVQWGSLLNRRNFRRHSDIDIAVEGILDAEAFFSMLADAEALTRFPIDLVQLEKIEPEFRREILEHGKVVYERDA